MAKRNLRGWYVLRWKILERDNFTCQYCGQYAPNVRLEVNHKIPFCEGGTDNFENLTTSCFACNHGKSGLRQSILLSKMANPVINGNLIIDSPPPAFRQTQVLHILEEHPNGLSNTELKDLAQVNRANMDMVVQRLKSKNLIEKHGKKWFLVK